MLLPLSISAPPTTIHGHEYSHHVGRTRPVPIVLAAKHASTTMKLIGNAPELTGQVSQRRGEGACRTILQT